MIILPKINKNLVTFSLIFFLVIPLIGIKIFFSLISNILLLLFLVPILILLISLISFNTLQSKIKICNQCGNISFGKNKTCINCGAEISNSESNNYKEQNNPSESIIEIKAEEIK